MLNLHLCPRKRKINKQNKKINARYLVRIKVMQCLVHQLLKQIRRGAGKEVLSSKTLKQLGSSLEKQLSKQLKTDYRITGVSKGRRPYSHYQAKRHFDIFSKPTYPSLKTSNVEHTKLIRNTKTHYIYRLSTILVIIFWNFATFYYRSDLPRVKGNLISSTANLVYELPHKLPNDLRLRKLGIIREISNLGGHIAQSLVSLQELRLCKQQLKKLAKTDTKLFFSCPVLLDYSTLFQIFFPGLQVIRPGKGYI